MREIKFRAWEPKLNSWSYWTLGDLMNMGSTAEIANEHFEFLPERWGQFTGLHDKNGTEIYEGDIFKAIAVDYGEVFVVEPMIPLSRFPDDFATNIGYFDDEGSYNYRQNLSGRYRSDDWISNPDDYEVIGNIYENPELVAK